MGNKHAKHNTSQNPTIQTTPDNPGMVPTQKKSILRIRGPTGDSNNESSSISSTSSTSSFAKQSVTFSDDVEPNNDTLTGNYSYARIKKVPSRRPISVVDANFRSDLSVSTETLQPCDDDWTLTLKSRRVPPGKIRIAYAKDYLSNISATRDEPFISDCELMPSYTATITSQIMRQQYRNYIDLSDDMRSKSVADRSPHVRNHVRPAHFGNPTDNNRSNNIKNINNTPNAHYQRSMSSFNGSLFNLNSSKYDSNSRSNRL